MKRITILALLATATLYASAQLTYGVRAGLGLATMKDDLSTHRPILGVNAGAYLDYSFAWSESVIGQMIHLQAGLNMMRRGCDYRNVFENVTDISIRTGHYHAWYLQMVPVTLDFQYELPIRSPGHVVGFFVGPAVSVGLFGSYEDRMVHPHSPDRNTNYDIARDGTSDDLKVFNHLNRLDASILVGFSYHRGKAALSFHIDHGLTATSESDDILRIIESQQAGNAEHPQVPNGHNAAYILSFSYQLGKF